MSFNKIDKNYSQHQLYYYRINAEDLEGNVKWVAVKQNQGTTQFIIDKNKNESIAIVSGICAVGILNEVHLIWNIIQSNGIKFSIIKFSHENDDVPISVFNNQVKDLLSDNILFD